MLDIETGCIYKTNCSLQFTVNCFRVIVSILDAFHFDLSKSQLNVKLVPVVTTEVIEETKQEPGIYARDNTVFYPMAFFYPIALIKAKIVYNFGLYECNRVKLYEQFAWLSVCFPGKNFFQTGSTLKGKNFFKS